MSSDSKWYYHAMTKGHLYADAKRCKTCKGACYLYTMLCETRFNLKRDWERVNNARRTYRKPRHSRYVQRRDEAIPERYGWPMRRLQNRLLHSI